MSGTSSDAVAPAAKAATTTRFTESTWEVNYGNESSVQFTAEVIGGDPEGESVEVKVGNAGSGSTACTAHLTAGVGKCSIEQNAALPAAFASYEVSASYAGDASLEPSRATITGGLTIDGGRTFTTVSVNPAKLTYGAETPVSVTAAVTAEGNTPLPSGETARITLAGESCTASLSGGAESTGSSRSPPLPNSRPAATPPRPIRRRPEPERLQIHQCGVADGRRKPDVVRDHRQRLPRRPPPSPMARPPRSPSPGCRPERRER